MSDSPAIAPGALSGLRVLELAQIMAGPTCGMMLADLGADVIKIEKIDGGDDARGYREPTINGVSAPFLMLNRNKRGIALDLKTPEGREVFLRMVRNADVVIENFRKGTLEKLGLGYDTLSRENPGLIYCAISGYGRTGPFADKGGFDLIAQGYTGLMSITGEEGGPPPGWRDVRQALPLLTRPEIAAATRYGLCRGYEAVDFVDKVRYFAFAIKGLVLGPGAPGPQNEKLAGLVLALTRP